MQVTDGLLGMGLDDVGNDDMTGIAAVYRHVNDGADVMTGNEVDAEPLHQLVIACGNFYTVHLGNHTVAADFLNVGYPAAVDRLAVGTLQAAADGVRGRTLCKGGQFEQFFVLELVVMDAADLKYALRERAGLVKHNGFDLRQRFQIIGTLDEHTSVACAADTGKEAQRNTDDQRTGAADDQEGERTVQPVAPIGRQVKQEHAHQRGQNEQGKRTVTDGGGVDAGKAGDERLGTRLARAGVLDQIENLGHGRLTELAGRANLEHTAEVDAAADDLVPGCSLAGQALAGQGAGVQRGRTLDDHAVDWDFLTRLHDDDRADLNLVRVDLLERTVLLDVGVIRADIHELTDVAAALADRVALEPLTDLIEQHNADGLGVVAALGQSEHDCTHGGDRHQKVFVEGLTVFDAFSGLDENIIADDGVGNHVQDKAQNAARRDKVQHHHEHGGDEDAYEHLFLFFVHERLSSAT